MNEIDMTDLILNNGSILNPALVKKKNLTLEQVEQLRKLHLEKDKIMHDAHLAIKEIEFQMQDVWGWERDETKHTHRFRVPCPHILNE